MPRKRSEADVQEEVKQLLEEIEVRRELIMRQGLSFASLNEEELGKKLRGETSNSPFFYWQGWTSATAPGSTASVQIGYRNPDPNFWEVSVTIFFGLANFAADITATLAGLQPSWPYVSDRSKFVAANGGTDSAAFNYTTPMIGRGTYNGNAVLWGPRTFDVGTYLDRSHFTVTLI